MSDNAELHQKILGFLAGEFAKKDGRQCIGVDLVFAPGQGFKDEEIRQWVRADQPELFDVPNNFVHLEKLVTSIIEVAEGEADAKPAGKHRFVVRTRQQHGDRMTQSFVLSPRYTGGDELALMAPGGGGRQDATGVLMNHAGQLMRINAQMYEGTIRVLGAQNADMRQENSELRADNIKLRRENDELRSNHIDREFQIAMAMEKNVRTKAGFDKLLQIGTVVAAKIAGGNEEAQGGAASPLSMLIAEFGKSLRKEQIAVLMNTLDMPQKMMFMEIMNMVTPPDQGAPSASPSLPGGTNGTT